ncbi:MAG TPA: SURF1 family protein [Ilumatobacteraceae bacterium]|nr:SURF1 family protein [Ilumatobacteraceae bacterium]
MLATSYRFLLKPKWIAFHVLVLAAIVAMVNLGFWQLRRLDERTTFNDKVTARSDAPVVTLQSLLADDLPPETLTYRRASVTGTYTDDPMVQIVNRSQGGEAGRNLVNALRTADGTVVLVNRGFISATASAPPVPTGPVTLIGRVRTSEQRRTGQVSDQTGVQLSEARRIDLAILGPQFGGNLAPVYLEVLESQPAEPSLTPVAAPELTTGTHLSYAIQWFIFSGCALAGWFFAVRRSANPTSTGKRRRRPPPIDDELSAEYARQKAAELDRSV